MTTASLPSGRLDLHAVHHWPIRAAAHALGIGLVLVVLIALPVAPSDLDRHQFPKETIWHAAVFAAVLLARPWPGAGERTALRIAMLLFGGWSLVAMLGATNPWLALRAASLTATSLIGLHTARYLAASGASGILLGWAAAAAGIGAATGLAQALGVEHAFFNTLRAPGGTFGNRNFLAHLAAAAVPLFAYLVLTVRRTWVSWAAAVGLGSAAAALVMTRSRAGWLAAIAGVSMMLLAVVVARRSAGIPIARSRIALMLMMAVCGAIAAVVVPTTLEWRSDSPYVDTLGNLANYREGSGRGRLLQYQNSLQLTRRHPLLGVGPGNWALRYGEVAPRGDPSFARNDVVPLNPWPSSDWVALASERGIPAVLAAALLALACLWRGVVAVRTGGERALAGAALLGTLAALAVAGLFDAVLLLAIPAGFAAITIGALLGRADGDADTATIPRRSLMATVLALVVLVGLVRSAMQTAGYVVAGNGRSRARLERAAMIDPFNYQLQIRLANGPCRRAKPHAAAALQLAPTWPAARAAARRCGIDVARN